MTTLDAFLAEVREMRCAPLLALMTRGIAALGPDVEPEVVSFGVRYRVGGQALCELSVFDDLFIARVGPRAAIEFRVRDETIALQALDGVVREYTRSAHRPASRLLEA